MIPEGRHRVHGFANHDLRPTTFRTLTEPGELTIYGLQFNKSPQLVGKIDAYQFSSKRHVRLLDEFAKENGLEGRTNQQIYLWCEEQELEPPGLPDLQLPTLKAGDRIELDAENHTPNPVSIYMWALSDQIRT